MQLNDFTQFGNKVGRFYSCLFEVTSVTHIFLLIYQATNFPSYFYLWHQTHLDIASSHTQGLVPGGITLGSRAVLLTKGPSVCNVRHSGIALHTTYQSIRVLTVSLNPVKDEVTC